jgi:hypothetical protein
MASNASPEHSGLATAERLAASTLRAITDVVCAIGEGIRARDDYRERVNHGDDPAKAAAAAVRYAEFH